MSDPVTISDIVAAAARLRPFLSPTPVRRYARLDALVGHGITVHLKHENHQPTQSFKVRNGLSALTALGPAERARGVIAATTGNHGLGLAYAGAQLGVRVTIVVPQGNNPSKNASVRALGAELIEAGAAYDEAVRACEALAAERGATLVHSTNDATVLAGAGTMSLEFLQQVPQLDALVIATGGGSQAVGAIVVARALHPALRVYAVQRAEGSEQNDSWDRGERLTGQRIATFAEGIATGGAYAMTFDTLRAGLSDFIAVPDTAIATAMEQLADCTGNQAEGAGAAGLAGAAALGARLAGQQVGVSLGGGNRRNGEGPRS
jgi:threonine dehydratase